MSLRKVTIVEVEKTVSKNIHRQESRRSLVDRRQSKKGRKCGKGESRASKDLGFKGREMAWVWQ